MATTTTISVRYATGTAGRSIAYTSRGSGPALAIVPHVQMSHLRREMAIDAFRAFAATVGRHRRLVRFDGWGSGLSGDDAASFAVDSLADDIRLVLDALGLEQAALFGHITGVLPAIAFAAAHPGRVTHLVLWNGFARHVEHGANPRMQALFAMAATDWELFTESISQAALGWRDAAASQQWAALVRESTTPARFSRYLEARRGWDVSGLLAQLAAPTLVLHDRHNALASEERSRELAAGIANAQFVEASSVAGMPDAQTSMLIDRFLRGGESSLPAGMQLSPRELEVLREVASGSTNAVVAERLSISVNTVVRHLTHIYTKTGTTNRLEAVRLAEQRGLVD